MHSLPMNMDLSPPPSPVAPLRWIGLVRTSSAEQAGGVLTQRGQVEAWCAGRGDELVTVLVDEGVPGTLEALGRRSSIRAALEILALGSADGVLVPKLDRLARDLILQERLIAEFQRAGGLVMSCQSGESDLLGPGVNDPTRKLVRQVLGAVGEFERAMIRHRAAAGATRARADGVWMGGRTPYGFQRSGRGKLVADEREQSIIGEGRTLREDFHLSLREVGEFWLQAGMPPRGASTSRHAPYTVGCVLAAAPRKGIRRRSLSPLGRQFAGLLPDERTVKFDPRAN